jgi:hypothetical protein
MNTNVFIDPSIDTESNKVITVIIQFITKPAQEAIDIAKKGGVPLTFENANWAVEHSHERFKEDLKRYLDSKHIPYKINHIYKTALNGVSMSLPANEIKTLLQSKEIQSIHANQEYKIEPQPSNLY